jgi:hypothetical protein
MNISANFFIACRLFHSFIHSHLHPLTLTMGDIYKIVLVTDGRTYVGKAADSNYKRPDRTAAEGRYWFHKNCAETNDDSCPKLYRSMRKHGIENFTMEVLEHTDDPEQLGALECKWVEELDTLNPVTGFNLAKPGGGGDTRAGKRKREGWTEGVTRVCTIKTCEQAGIPQPVANFHFNNKIQIDGRVSICKTCSAHDAKSRVENLSEEELRAKRARDALSSRKRKAKPEVHAKILQYDRKIKAIKNSTVEGKEQNRSKVAEWRAKKEAENPQKYKRWQRKTFLRRRKKKDDGLSTAEQKELTILDAEFAKVPLPVPVAAPTVRKRVKVNTVKATTNATEIRRAWMEEFSTAEPDKFEKYKRVQSLRAASKARTLNKEETEDMKELEAEFPKYWSYKISKRPSKAYMRTTISSES